MSLLTSRVSPCRGFTLVELLITIAIMSILLMAAIPNFTEAMLSSKLNGYATSLVSSARLARSEAVKRNATVRLCVSTDGSTCATGLWSQGWIVLSGTTVIERQPAAAAGYRMSETSGTSNLTFDATGVGASTAEVTVCYKTSKTGSQERVVRINAVGKAAITTTRAGVCA